MICLKLKFEDCGRLCSICDSIKDICNVDVKCGRYVVDGTSLLGVMSFTGHIVELIPLTFDESAYNNFYNKVKELGAYIK